MEYQRIHDLKYLSLGIVEHNETLKLFLA